MSDELELTVLTTEHYTLQSARQACLQDMQGRATLFLYSVSAVLVALGFMASASARQQFIVFSVTLLSALWVLGILTFLRLGQLAVEDTIIVFGISRIRHRYLELQPALEGMFVRSIHDDLTGLQEEMGASRAWWQFLMPTTTAVSFVDSVVGGADLSVILSASLHVSLMIAVVAGVLGGVLNMTVLTLMRSLWPGLERYPAKFPSSSKTR